MIWQGKDREGVRIIIMFIQELAYDPETDELDLLIDTSQPQPAETIHLGNDIFVRRSLTSNKIVGAVIANYSLWHPNRFPSINVDPGLAQVRHQIIQYLSTMKRKPLESRLAAAPLAR